MIDKISAEMVDKRFNEGKFESFVLSEQTLVCIWRYKPTSNSDSAWEIIKTASCVSPENFNRCIGEEVGKQNIKEAIWKMLGYELFLYKHNQLIK